jgi:hypothetical protein
MKLKLWQLIEDYRMSGGRVEHHAKKKILEDYIDSLLILNYTKAQLNEFEQMKDGTWEADRNG